MEQNNHKSLRAQPICTGTGQVPWARWSILVSHQPYGMGFILPFYRWQNGDSEMLTDMAKVSLPGEEPGFGHGSVLLQPSACPSVAQASLLPGRQHSCRV